MSDVRVVALQHNGQSVSILEDIILRAIHLQESGY